MPKISDERRTERRTQIIDAARACFDRQGPHATTMDDIIRASGLSAGAVYGYFSCKDELVVAALTASLSGLRDVLVPIFQRQPLPLPGEFVRLVVAEIVHYSTQDRFDLRRVAVQGWAEALRNEPLRKTLCEFYFGFRGRLEDLGKEWHRSGLISPLTDLGDVAKTLLALFLGYVAEATILGDVEAASIGAGLESLLHPPLKQSARNLPSKGNNISANAAGKGRDRPA